MITIKVLHVVLKWHKPKMTKLTRDVQEYTIFRADFKHAMEFRYSKRDSIMFLSACLQGQPLDLIKGIGFDYDAAWDYLDCIYGDPCFVSHRTLLTFAYYSMARMHDSAILCTNWPDHCPQFAALSIDGTGTTRTVFMEIHALCQI